MCVHLFILFHSSQQSQRHFNRCFCFDVVFLYRFLFTHHFSFVHQVCLVQRNRWPSLNFVGYDSCCHHSFALYTDCLSVDRLHVDCHEGLLKHVVILLLKLGGVVAAHKFSIGLVWAVRICHLCGEVVRVLGQAWQATGRMASRKMVFLWSLIIVVLLRILFGSFKHDSRLNSVSGHSVRHNNNCEVIHKGQHQYYVNAHFRRSSDEVLVNCLCHPLLHAVFSLVHGVCQNVRPKTKNKP